MQPLRSFLIFGATTLILVTPGMGSVCSSVECIAQYNFCIGKNCPNAGIGDKRKECIKNKCQYIWTDCLERFNCPKEDPPGDLAEPLDSSGKPLISTKPSRPRVQEPEGILDEDESADL